MAELMLLPLTVFCFTKIQIGFTFLVPAYLSSPGKRAVKQVCVCVCVCEFIPPDISATARAKLETLNFVHEFIA